MSLKFNIYDANNYFRLKLETDNSGLTIRGIMVDVTTNPGMNIMIWDGAGGNERRQKLYPEYKANREPAGESIWESMKLLRKVLTHSNCTQICVPGYEADDVIAHMAVRLREHGPVHIWSTDGDLCQLCQIPGVTHMRAVTKVEPEWIRLYKTFVGDTSDNIKGVKGFGEGAWEKADKELLLKFVNGEVGDILGAGASKAANTWAQANRDIVQTMWTITGFMDVSKEDVDKNTVVGVPNTAEADKLLKEFLL